MSPDDAGTSKLLEEALKLPVEARAALAFWQGGDLVRRRSLFGGGSNGAKRRANLSIKSLSVALESDAGEDIDPGGLRGRTRLTRCSRRRKGTAAAERSVVSRPRALNWLQ